MGEPHGNETGVGVPVDDPFYRAPITRGRW